MKRRQFLATLGAASVSRPMLARSQPVLPRIGFLGAATPNGYARQVESLKLGLRELGYEDGRDVLLDFRWALGDYARLAALARELVDSRPNVIVTHGYPATAALKQASRDVPIVVATTSDIAMTGLVDSLAHPGGTITGLSFFAPQISAKRLEILKECIPGLTSLATVFNVANPVAQPDLRALGSTARSLGVELRPVAIQSPQEFEAAFATIASSRVGAVSLIHDALLTDNVRTLANLCLKHRLASIGEGPYVKAGGLVGYGPDFYDMFRRSASYVAKILRGSHPRDLPIEQPIKFDYVFNLRTADYLGLEVPPSALARASELVE
ncbi:protein of unknown function DUF534 [Methylobacterium sp. 4-46]|nr:protein of unknown function DUF534 [Methylobacterium sp. 4-46]